MNKIIILFIFFFLFIQDTYSADTTNKKDMVTIKNNEKAEKDCELVEQYIPIEKDNIQNITGTGLEVSGVKLRPEGCAWNPEKGWFKPKN